MKNEDRDARTSLGPIFEILRDSSIYGINRVVGVLIGIASVPIFARIMSPDTFGTYSLALLSITLAYQVVNEWARSSILRYDSKYKESISYRSYLSNVFIPPILLGAAFAFIMLVAVEVLGLFSSIEGFIPVSLAVFLSSIAFSMLVTLLRVRQRSKAFSLFQISNRLLALSIGIAIVLIFDSGAKGLLYGMLAAFLILLPLAAGHTGILRTISFRLLSPKLIKRFVAYGFPLTLFALSSFFMRYTDRYMISYFRDIQEVGLYSFAYMIPQKTIGTIIGIVALGSFPVIVREWEQKSRESATSITSTLAKYHMLLTVPIVSLLVMYPRFIVSIAGTGEYVIGYKAVPLVALASYFSSVSWFSAIAFNLSTRTKQLLLVTILSLSINVILNLGLIPRSGYLGAAIATMLTSIFYCGIVFYLARKWLPWTIRRDALLKVGVANIISISLSVFTCKIVDDGSYLCYYSAIAVYIVAYFASLLALKTINYRAVLALFLR